MKRMMRVWPEDLCLRSAQSFVPLQLPSSPLRVFAIGIEHSRDAPIKRLQGRDTGKLDRPAVFGRQRQDSAAVVTGGASRSDFGTVFPRWATASRSVVSLAPSASTIGSANRLS
jgi:hypothetical protein